MKKSGYIGRVKNSGTQIVKAPVSGEGKGGKASVVKGKDLRTGK